MPFNIMLHTVRKHYAVQYHAAYSTQALCHTVQYHAAYSMQASIMPFNIMLHTVQALCRSISCCMQYAALFLFNIVLHTARKHYAVQYQACIQYASIMQASIMIQYHAAYSKHKHYAVQYRAAYSTQALCQFNIMVNITVQQALCHSISCCIQYMQIPYRATYRTQTLCRSISSCILYASIMPFNIMLHTVRKHYAVQYHAAYSTQAL